MPLGEWARESEKAISLPCGHGFCSRVWSEAWDSTVIKAPSDADPADPTPPLSSEDPEAAHRHIGITWRRVCVLTGFPGRVPGLGCLRSTVLENLLGFLRKTLTPHSPNNMQIACMRL